MNERNLAALEGIVLAMAEEFGTTLDGLEWDAKGRERVAEWLSHRVLVPSAVTDDDVNYMAMCCNSFPERPKYEDNFRAGLERIAKGQP